MAADCEKPLLIARPWAKISDYWEVHRDLTRRVKERFDAEGINIPLPQRDLHLPGTIEVRLAANDRNEPSVIHTTPSSTLRQRELVTVGDPAPVGEDDDDQN